MLERIIKSAILPVLASAFLLQGCGHFTSTSGGFVLTKTKYEKRDNVKERFNGEPEVISKEEKRECTEYQIGEVELQGNSLKIPVQKRKILETTIQKEITTPVYEGEYNVTIKREVHPIFTNQDEISPEEERHLINKIKIKEDKEFKEERNVEELSPSKPAANVAVYVNGECFNFDRAKTDANGIAFAKITAAPIGWITSAAEQYSETPESEKIRAEKERALESLTLTGYNELKCRYNCSQKSCKLEIEALPDEEDVSTPKKALDIKGWQVTEILAPQPYEDSNDYMEGWTNWLSEKISSSIQTGIFEIEVRDYDTHAPISAEITYTKKSGLSVNDIDKTKKRIKDKYFSKNGPIYKIDIDSANYIHNPSNNDLSGQVNIPSTYTISSMNSSYYFVEGNVTFKEDSMKKTIYMMPKGASITVEDKRKGKIVDE
jgi:hypothetical protein